jgi:GAF domain-containing protein
VNTEKIAHTFVELADSLVDDFDALDLLNVLVERCVDLLGVDAAGLLFADGQNQLRVAVSSSESARLLDLYQLQSDEGPCLECYHSGRPVSAELSESAARWPKFTAAATSEGFVGVLALPLRLRGRVLGALNLFDAKDGTLSDPEIWPVAQSMADVATIAILQERLGQQRDLLNEQLQSALTSRVAIEQAKGVLASQLDIEMEEAFELLRKRSRDQRRRIAEVAEEVVNARTSDLLAAFGDRA